MPIFYVAGSTMFRVDNVCNRCQDVQDLLQRIWGQNDRRGKQTLRADRRAAMDLDTGIIFSLFLSIQDIFHSALA